MLSLLRQDSYSVLEGRLSEAVAKDPTLAPARSLLLLPLELLDALAGDAEAALGDDPLAAERMRVLLCAAGPHAIPPSAAEALGEKAGAPGSDEEGASDVAAMHAPCMLNLGTLVIVGLAAGRAGSRVGLGTQLVNTILGLALAAGPAEGLAHLGGAGLAGNQLHALLSGLSAPNQISNGLSLAVATFLTDPLQRARWRCMKHLISLVSQDVARTRWDGADALPIAAVEAH